MLLATLAYKVCTRAGVRALCAYTYVVYIHTNNMISRLHILIPHLFSRSFPPVNNN